MKKGRGKEFAFFYVAIDAAARVAAVFVFRSTCRPLLRDPGPLLSFACASVFVLVTRKGSNRALFIARRRCLRLRAEYCPAFVVNHSMLTGSKGAFIRPLSCHLLRRLAMLNIIITNNKQVKVCHLCRLNFSLHNNWQDQSGLIFKQRDVQREM